MLNSGVLFICSFCLHRGRSVTTLRSGFSLMKYERMFVCPKWQVNVGHPSEVDEIFDAISYSKGASVIRMLHDYVGDEVRKKKPEHGNHSLLHNLDE